MELLFDQLSIEYAIGSIDDNTVGWVETHPGWIYDGFSSIHWTDNYN